MSRPSLPRNEPAPRALTPAVGVVLLVAVAVTLATVVGTAALVIVDETTTGGPRASLGLSVDAATDRLVFTHRAGEPLRVTALAVRVRVAGTPLDHQPPVPFFAARGFRGGPTGPFNAAADHRWSAGERAGFRLASTNAPTLDPGDRVTVRLFVDGRRVATLSARAE